MKHLVRWGLTALLSVTIILLVLLLIEGEVGFFWKYVPLNIVASIIASATLEYLIM